MTSGSPRLPRQSASSGSSSRAQRLGVATVAVSFFLFCAACGPDTESSSAAAPKVVLVGIDGADWSVIEPLLEAGELPVFEKMRREGAHGVLHASGPLLSPPIWTTIATGKPLAEHGIDGFFYEAESGEEVLVDSSRRRVSALWNWMTPLRKTVGFAGWWASWPAEEVNGWVLSDRFARSQWSYWPTNEQGGAVTFPEELVSEFPGFDSPEAARWAEEVTGLAEFTESELEELAGFERPVPYNRLSDLKFGYVAQRAYEEAFLDLVGRDQPDLAAVFLIANDPISHSFWKYYEPEHFDVDPEEVARFSGILREHWKHLDSFLGRLRSAVDLETTSFVIVSDHGFEANPEDDPSGDHTREGIWLVSGPNTDPSDATTATILDVAPTILRLLGAPVPDDLPGEAIPAALSAGFQSRYPERSISSFEPYFSKVAEPDVAGPGDEEMRRQLESLGYLDR